MIRLTVIMTIVMTILTIIIIKITKDAKEMMNVTVKNNICKNNETTVATYRLDE
jgi:hypothetical protein